LVGQRLDEAAAEAALLGEVVAVRNAYAVIGDR
jgi:hypothetical protein